MKFPKKDRKLEKIAKELDADQLLALAKEIERRAKWFRDYHCRKYLTPKVVAWQVNRWN